LNSVSGGLPTRRYGRKFKPEFRSWPVGSCDAPSQKGVGDAIVTRWLNGFTEGVKKCDEGVAATLW